MKIAVLLSCVFATILLFSCQTTATNFDWLVGKWQRVNGKEEEKTFENWKKISAESYKGLGFTLVERDTVFKENLSLLKVNNEWVLQVEGVHEDVVLFPLEEIQAKSFKAVNLKNVFPKEIKYQAKGNNILEATIASGKDSAVFKFERIK